MSFVVVVVIFVAFASAQDSGIGVPSGKKSNDKSLCQTCDLPEKWRVGCNQAYQACRSEKHDISADQMELLCGNCNNAKEAVKKCISEAKEEVCDKIQDCGNAQMMSCFSVPDQVKCMSDATDKCQVDLQTEYHAELSGSYNLTGDNKKLWVASDEGMNQIFNGTSNEQSNHQTSDEQVERGQEQFADITLTNEEALENIQEE